MSYLALYRKYRPQTFEEVRGQDHIVTTLKNQMKTGRIGHAYLFCGTRGTGKTSVAKLFAKAVNCENPVDGSPCGKCAVCRSIDSMVSMNVTELDAASNNSVDNIRDIIDSSRYSPTEGKYKVYIIDEVHMLSTSAFNALLKTLEEPPEYVIFILATTEVHKIPITILSRCQRYDFKRITTDIIAGCLADLMKSEGIPAEEKALKFIARAADGSMRDAESLLDQCIAFYIGQDLTYDKVLEVLGSVDVEVFARLLRHIGNGDVSGCMKILDEVMVSGRELTQFVNDFSGYLRNLLLARSVEDPYEVLELSKENMELVIHESKVADSSQLIRYIGILSELSNRIRYATQKRLLIEVELIKLAKPQMQDNYDSLVDRIRVLEEKLENGEFTVSVGKSENNTAAEKDTEEAEQVPEELAKALPEDIAKVANSWNSITSSMNSKDKLAATMLSDAGAFEEKGKLVIEFKNGLDVQTMNYKKEISGETGPSRIDILKQVIASVTGLDIEIETRSAEQGKSVKGTDIRKRVKFNIEKID